MPSSTVAAPGSPRSPLPYVIGLAMIVGISMGPPQPLIQREKPRIGSGTSGLSPLSHGHGVGSAYLPNALWSSLQDSMWDDRVECPAFRTCARDCDRLQWGSLMITMITSPCRT
eukprot:553316-Amorphochlora_amoeboformis.AAC.1